jgi:hypothetical protein
MVAAQAQLAKQQFEFQLPRSPTTLPAGPPARPVDAAKCQALAQHMRAEIERIITNSKSYVP